MKKETALSPKTTPHEIASKNPPKASVHAETTGDGSDNLMPASTSVVKAHAFAQNSIDHNRKRWNETYDWSEHEGGEVWSGGFGSSAAQWQVSIMPRLQRYLPSKHILEIAPGFGRWTRFLLNYCEEFTGVDLSEKCVSFCSGYFGVNENQRFLVNDGKSFSSVPDSSVDLVFCYDSLVHAKFEAFQGYVPEVLRVLKPDGKCFVHHSNFAALEIDRVIKEIPRYGWRAKDVSADIIAELIESHNGVVISQELHDWGFVREPIDCLTIFGNTDCVPSTPQKLVNTRFMAEGNTWRSLSSMYFDDDDWSIKSKKLSQDKR